MMKRLFFGVLVAVVLAVPLIAQDGLNVSFTVTAAKVELLKDALVVRSQTIPRPPGTEPPVVDDAFTEGWIKSQCRQAIDQTITQYERDEARAGGALDVSTLTRAQRLQVKALIASFQK